MSGLHKLFCLIGHGRSTTAICALVLCAGSVARASTSYTGTLATPEDTFETTIVLASPGSITLQTFGFGGGTNSAGTAISAGGVDPLVALFSGTGPGAVFINGTSDDLANYSSYQGCPPAGTVTIGSFSNQCGDITIQFAGLAAGIYTILLSDGAYIPNAFFEAPPAFLGDGFTDLTSGFQTCVDAQDCVSDTGAWALDITTGGGPGVPEPGSLGFAIVGMMLMMFARVRLKRRN